MIPVTWRCPECGNKGTVQLREPRSGELKDHYMSEVLGREVSQAHRRSAILCEEPPRFDLKTTRKKLKEFYG